MEEEEEGSAYRDAESLKSRGLGGECVVRGEIWRGVAWRRCDDGIARAGVQWRGSLAGYVKTILSRSGPAYLLIYGIFPQRSENTPSNLKRSKNAVFNSQVLAHSCWSSSGKKPTLGTSIPARDLPLARLGFGVKKSGVMGAEDCLTRACLASNSLADIRVPGIERPAARKELMTLEDTDS